MATRTDNPPRHRLGCAVSTAYPLSRYRSRWKRPFLLTVLFMAGLPSTTSRSGGSGWRRF